MPPKEASQSLKDSVRQMLEEIGENPHREGLQDTPKRYAKAIHALTEGYHKDPREVVNGALFEHESNEVVLVRDIELYSLCEHHILPFFGKAHIAYLPNKKIIGLSKVARLVDVFARRLQVQERLTTQISQAMMEILNPLGVAVIIEAHHLCMMMRGVEKQNSATITSSMLGEFRDNANTRKELLELLNRRA